MLKIELTVPKGLFGGEALAATAERMLDDISRGDCQTPRETAAARAGWQVVVHEAVVWATGGDPRPVVRVSFPAAMLTDEGREVFMTKLAAALDPLKPWIYFDAVPDGDFGVDAPMRAAELIRDMRAAMGAETIAAVPIRAGEATAIDPVCGMTVALSGEPILVEHDGENYAFCNRACAASFAERVAV
ncbi:hypothetical protein [Phytomonospora endophytica]|uniref:YHS domain-containing protein n=1 Tax=Phytomonospora endophytica TaxID=714109 RepID=A0A841FGG0_9ACTN|nr:hypothetical protein [Phytomonospora endophytica]MBB6034954.1 YHS domain-containing protein [Phytomonospora endophytica]GIG70656.1 hypothetical protein Pen01_69510 [Phytomonospora endophytica]